MTMNEQILIIDDDPSWTRFLSFHVEELGFEVSTAATIKDGFKALEEKEFDLVFLDVSLPDGNGLNVLPQVQTARSQPEVIILTGEGDSDGAELSIRSGAWNYLEKTGSPSEISLNLNRALKYRKERLSSKPISLRREGLIGKSHSFMNCLDQIAEAALSEANALLYGETGTGKELMAATIHKNGKRAKNNFVVVDCASLPEQLVESILFGNSKGAFTSADQSKEGLVYQAQNGTLFLDEVGELPLNAQKAFLRVLQEHTIQRVGDVKTIPVDFRLVAATNRDLGEMVKSGRFRSDLYFRLQALTINIPPLRSRKEDVAPIADYHLKRTCDRHGIGMKGVSPDFYETLEAYDWPGNVRELVNAISTAITRGLRTETLFAKHLPNEIRAKAARKTVKGIPVELPSENLPSYKAFRTQIITRADDWYFAEVVRRSGGASAKAMEITELGKSRLFQLLKEHGLSLSDVPTQ